MTDKCVIYILFELKYFMFHFYEKKDGKNYSPWINSMSGKLDNNSVL